MKSTLFTIILLITLLPTVLAQTDIVSGNAKTYAGDTLMMYAIDNYITRNETPIATAVVDANGNFTFKAPVQYITQAYIDLSVFKCMIYLQPGKNQRIVLPEKQKIKPQDELNPFFKKYEFYPKLIDPSPDDLNTLIPRFDYNYGNALNKIITAKYGVTKAIVDSVESIISARYPKNNTYFNDYMKYRFAMLDHIAYHRNKDILISEYFTGKEVLYRNPAYCELFDEMFPNMFSNFKHHFTSNADKSQAIDDKSYHALKRSLAAEPKVASSQLADYMILKGLKDSYYADTIPKENLVAIADSVAYYCGNKDFRNIASTLSTEFTTLLCGHAAPKLDLSDINGERKSLYDFAGKFAYVMFFNPDSYTALSDLELIKGIRQDFPPGILDIVIVFVSSSREDYTDFVASDPELELPVYWYNGNKEMLRKYNVRAYPTYYLISPESLINMNPAPSPTENFQPKFDASYRTWRNDRARKQYQNSPGIK
ncbi:MAG: peroxiredoxin family protein [Bacteroidales bacterium]|nr:peroxiredoxin family protein [Bacteroidales bacterium]